MSGSFARQRRPANRDRGLMPQAGQTNQSRARHLSSAANVEMRLAGPAEAEAILTELAGAFPQDSPLASYLSGRFTLGAAPGPKPSWPGSNDESPHAEA